MVDLATGTRTVVDGGVVAGILGAGVSIDGAVITGAGTVGFGVTDLALVSDAVSNEEGLAGTDLLGIAVCVVVISDEALIRETLVGCGSSNEVDALRFRLYNAIGVVTDEFCTGTPLL